MPVSYGYGSPIRTTRVPALFAAVESDNKEEVSRLLKKERNIIKKKNADSQTILHVATIRGNEDIVKLIVDKSSALINLPDIHGMSPVHIAAQQGNFNLCEYLINSKADLNAVNNHGETLLHTLAMTEIDPVNFKVFKHALIVGADPSICDHQGNTIAHAAAKVGNEQTIISLKPFKQILEAKDRHNQTPLQCAAKNGHLSTVQLLLSMGVGKGDFQHECDTNVYPENICAKYKTKEDSRLPTYISVNASVPQPKPKRLSLKWSTGKSVILNELQQFAVIDQINQSILQLQDPKPYLKKEYRAVISREGTNNRCPLNLAAECGHLEMVMGLIRKMKADVNSIDGTGKTPLLLAAKYGKFDIVEFLLTIPTTNTLAVSKSNSKSILHYIVQHSLGNVESILRIVKKVVDNGLDINSKTRKQGYTAAHIAAICGNTEAMNLLHFIRADLELPCLNGMKPIQIVAQNEHLSTLKLLLQLGVDRSVLQYSLENDEFSNTIASLIKSEAAFSPRTKRKSIRESITHALQTLADTHDNNTSNSPSNLSNTVVTQDMFTAQDHPIHSMIARKVKLTELAKYIKKEGIEVLSIPNLAGQTALHIATQLHLQELSATLIEKYHVSLDRKDDAGETPLHIAAGNNDMKTCSVLIDNGANPSIQNNIGNFLHILSSQHRDRSIAVHLEEIVGTCLAKGFRLDDFNSEGYAPIHIAAACGNTTLISVLLQSGTPIELPSKNENLTALQIAAFNSQKAAVRLLRFKGASLHVFDDLECLSPEILEVIQIVEPQVEINFDIALFHRAICIGEKLEVRRLLKKDPTLIHSVDENRSTPLSLATSVGNFELVELFLERNVNVNAKDAKGLSPLFIAILSGSLNIVDALLKKGADPLAIGKNGDTFLHSLGSSTKILSLQNDILEEIVNLLVRKGVNINATNHFGDTALHVACKHRNSMMVKALLALNANPNVYNGFGETPIFLAIKTSALDAVKFLFERNVDTSCLECDLQDENVTKELSDFLYRNRINLKPTEEQENTYAKRTNNVHHSISRIIKLAESAASRNDRMKILAVPTGVEEKYPDILSTVSFSPELDEKIVNLWNQKYNSSCSRRGVSSGELDKRGLMMLMEDLNIYITEAELGLITRQLDKPTFSFELLLDNLGTSWKLFQNLTSVPSIEIPRAIDSLKSPRFYSSTCSSTEEKRSSAPLKSSRKRSRRTSIHNIKLNIAKSISPKYNQKQLKEGEVEEATQEILNQLPDVTPRTFANEILSADALQEHKKYKAYFYFADLYNRILQAENTGEFTKELFMKYFKDSFSSKVLTQNIIPTIMQNFSETQTITQDAFCAFFISQRSLVHLMEVVFRVNDTVDLYLQDLKQYKTYPGTEKVKIRLFVAELARQLDQMAMKFDDFIIKNSAQSLDPLDTSILDLRKRIAEDRKVISDLTPPRQVKKITEKSIANSSDKKKRRQGTISIQRIIQCSSGDISKDIQSKLTSYGTLTGLENGCVSSSIDNKNNIILINQLWSNSENLKKHLQSIEFGEYQKIIQNNNNLSENVSVQRIQAV